MLDEFNKTFEEMIEIARERQCKDALDAYLNGLSLAQSKIDKAFGHKVLYQLPRAQIQIKKVVFHDPATIVFWDDGTKTVVKCQDSDTYSKETGLALCIAKKVLGNKGNFNNVFKKWCEE